MHIKIWYNLSYTKEDKMNIFSENCLLEYQKSVSEFIENCEKLKSLSVKEWLEGYEIYYIGQYIE